MFSTPKSMMDSQFGYWEEYVKDDLEDYEDNEEDYEDYEDYEDNEDNEDKVEGDKEEDYYKDDTNDF